VTGKKYTDQTMMADGVASFTVGSMYLKASVENPHHVSLNFSERSTYASSIRQDTHRVAETAADAPASPRPSMFTSRYASRSWRGKGAAEQMTSGSTTDYVYRYRSRHYMKADAKLTTPWKNFHKKTFHLDRMTFLHRITKYI